MAGFFEETGREDYRSGHDQLGHEATAHLGDTALPEGLRGPEDDIEFAIPEPNGPTLNGDGGMALHLPGPDTHEFPLVY